MDEIAISEPKNWKKNPLLISFVVYSCAWVLTGLISYLFWGAYLPQGNAASYFLAFILPLVLVELVAYWSMGHENIFLWVNVSFFIILILVFLNLFFFHIPTLNYGDNGYLSMTVGAGIFYPRWMLGSSILKSIYISLLSPLVNQGILPAKSTADIFIRYSGSLVMIVFSLLLMKRYPNRLMVLLPLSIPIWLLLSSGYNEYYPFIAPVFVYILILFFEWDMRGIKPITMGLLLSSIGLLYAGFLPISLFLLLLYLKRAGFKAAFQSCVYSGVWAMIIIVLFWPNTMPGFFTDYRHSLSLGDENSPVSEIGKAIQRTPFYKIRFALAFDNIKRLFFMLFWGGGLSTLFIITGTVYLFIKKHQFKSIKNILFIAIFFAYEVFFLFFKIPKAGMPDIDLYFQVYITFAFVAGFLVDEFVQPLPPRSRIFWQLISFSMVVGNTSFVLLYLLFLGLPIPK